MWNIRFNTAHCDDPVHTAGWVGGSKSSMDANVHVIAYVLLCPGSQYHRIYTSYMHIQYKITLNRSNNLHILFYVWLQKFIKSSENEYHDKSWKIKVYRLVWFQEESKFEKANFEMHFEGTEVCSNDYQCAQFISWTFIKHHLLTNRSINRCTCISRWSTWLGISHIMPFNINFHGLYWRAHRQVKWCTADNK